MSNKSLFVVYLFTVSCVMFFSSNSDIDIWHKQVWLMKQILLLPFIASTMNMIPNTELWTKRNKKKSTETKLTTLVVKEAFKSKPGNCSLLHLCSLFYAWDCWSNQVWSEAEEKKYNYKRFSIILFCNITWQREKKHKVC